MSKRTNTKSPRLGIFYRSNGRWTGPYNGVTYTANGWKRTPIRETLNYVKNDVLKSRVLLCPVG